MPVASVVAGVAWATLGLGAQTPASAAGSSAAGAKDLVAALQSKKLEAFAVQDPAKAGRFVAVLIVPTVQLLVVAANYERASDIEYRIYQKDYQGAYADLRSGVMSSNRVLIEDALCDGLVAQPSKGQPVSDTATMQSAKYAFDGVVADPKKKNDKRITRDAYQKAFADAEAEYQRLLATLLDGLRKGGTVLGPGAGLR